MDISDIRYKQHINDLGVDKKMGIATIYGWFHGDDSGI